MKPDAKTVEGTTALMLAARDLEKVKLLIERGADVNAWATTGLTPLMVAARYRGNAEVVRLLLKKGARPTRIATSLEMDWSKKLCPKSRHEAQNILGLLSNLFYN